MAAHLLDVLAVLDLDRVPGEVHVNCPRDANRVVKGLDPADRRWDGARHVWIVDRGALTDVTDALLDAGFLVDVWHRDDVTMLSPDRRTVARP